MASASEKTQQLVVGSLEWEPIKPAQRRRLQSCYDHAMKLAAKGEKYDFDYAHTMLAQCVKEDPANMVYVEAMLENLHKKYKNNKRGGGSTGSRGAFKKAVSKGEWEEVLKLGPDVLKANPWDVPTLRGIADACAAFGLHEVELRYLKNALDANPKNIEVNKHCAASLARIGQFDQAIACWNRIGEIRRKDPEVDEMISKLTLEKTRALTGLGEDDTATGKVVNEELAAAQARKHAEKVKQQEQQTPAKKREIRLTPRQQLERAISEDPEVLENYLKLADLILADGRPGEAVQVLTKALGVAGGDLQVQERLESAQLQHMRVQIAVAEKRAAADGGEEATELVKQLKDQLHRRELEIYSNRVERHPQDVQLKFELGVRLKRVGNIDEAEKVFMEVREDPKLKAAATIEVGECLQRQQKYNHALQFYVRAVELTAKGDANLRKLALYRAGVLAVGLRQLDKAEKWLKELSSLDRRYRDVKARLDKVAELRHKG